MIQYVRELAEKYSHEELEGCIDQEISEGTNTCHYCETAEETVNVLSKASWVKKQIEDGHCQSVSDGIRKLAASMRAVQQTS